MLKAELHATGESWCLACSRAQFMGSDWFESTWPLMMFLEDPYRSSAHGMKRRTNICRLSAFAGLSVVPSRCGWKLNEGVGNGGIDKPGTWEKSCLSYGVPYTGGPQSSSAPDSCCLHHKWGCAWWWGTDRRLWGPVQHGFPGFRVRYLKSYRGKASLVDR